MQQGPPEPEPQPKEEQQPLPLQQAAAGEGAAVLDLDRPLLPQVEDLCDQSAEEIEAIYHRSATWAARTPLLFDPKFGRLQVALERLTRTGPLQVAAAWVPVSAWAFWLCACADGSSVPRALAAFAFGLFKWSLIEYVMHRFLFHSAPPTGGSALARFRRKVHFSSHAVHHVAPSDPYRLNVPPFFCAFPIAAWWGVAWLLYGRTLGNGVLSGALLGYVVYEQVHHAVHYRPSAIGRPGGEGGPEEGEQRGNKGGWRARWWSRRWTGLADAAYAWMGATPAARKRHVRHHNSDEAKGYGVSGNFWDRVFGTLQPHERQQQPAPPPRPPPEQKEPEERNEPAEKNEPEVVVVDDHDDDDDNDERRQQAPAEAACTEEPLEIKQKTE